MKYFAFFLLFSNIVLGQEIPKEWQQIKKKHFKVFIEAQKNQHTKFLNGFHDFSSKEYDGTTFFSLEFKDLKKDHDINDPKVKESLSKMLASYDKYYSKVGAFKTNDYCKALNTKSIDNINLMRLFQIHALSLYLSNNGTKEFEKHFVKNYKQTMKIVDCSISLVDLLILKKVANQYHEIANELKIDLSSINNKRFLNRFNVYLILRYYQTLDYLTLFEKELKKKPEKINDKIVSQLVKIQDKSLYDSKMTRELILKAFKGVEKRLKGEKINLKKFSFFEKSYLKNLKKDITHSLGAKKFENYSKKNSNIIGRLFLGMLLSIGGPNEELDNLLKELQ